MCMNMDFGTVECFEKTFALYEKRFELYSALIATEKWAVTNLPWHGFSVYDGHHRWSVTRTAVTEHLAEYRHV